MIQGFNVSVIAMGSSGSGKSHTLCGSGEDIGIVQYFVEALFNSLDNKDEVEEEEEKVKTETETERNYTLRMQLIEIVNEGVNDLLAKGKGGLAVEADDWEGAKVQGADRREIGTVKEFAGIYSFGLKNRTALVNTFGKLADKAATILILELVQTINLEEETEAQVLVSKGIFIECPGTESLIKDLNNFKGKQSIALNQGMISLQKVIKEVMTGQIERADYGGSQLTRMMEEVLGGNSLTSIIFNFQYDDQIGSTATIQLLKHCQRIVNFPIPNDSRAICLIHKHRVTINNLRQIIQDTNIEKIEEYQARIAELERKLIDGNIDEGRLNEERNEMDKRLQQLKDKYNALLKQKANIQKQLLVVEEEKLSISQGLIVQQIENSKLKEELEIIRYELAEKGGSELEQNKNTVNQLQESLQKLKEEKNEFEVELITVKRNYFNKCKELEELKKKNEQIGIEFVNAMNENELLKRKGGLSRTVITSNDTASRKVTLLEAENTKLKKELTKLELELEKLTSEKIKGEAKLEQMKLEFDKKQVALEKEYIEFRKNKDIQIHDTRKLRTEANRIIEDNRTTLQIEKLDLVKKIKNLQRKLEITESEVIDLKEQNDELRKDRRILEVKLDNTMNTLRNRLENLVEQEATGELLRTYESKEKQLVEDTEIMKKNMEKLRIKCKTLREYARQLKYLCEDLYPEGKLLPDILQNEPPLAIGEEEDKSAKREETLRRDLRRYKEENNELRITVDELNERIRKMLDEQSLTSETLIQQKILEEVKMLKERPRMVQKAMSSEENFEDMRKERNKLLEENLRLRQTVI